MNELIFYDLKPSNRQKLCMSTQIAQELGRQIVGGQILSEQAIEGEAQLASRFNVCRTVAREAIQLLARKGLVAVRRKRGIRARHFQEWQLLDDDVLAWIASGHPNHALAQKLIEFRLSFEPKAAYWAAERGTEESLENIQMLCRQVTSSNASNQNRLKAEGSFHNAILKASKNEILFGMDGLAYSSILVSSQIIALLDSKESDVFTTYEQLSTAIVKRDKCEAERLCESLLLSKLKLIRASTFIQ